MPLEVTINGSTAPEARYVAWTPSELTLRFSPPTSSASPVTVQVRDAPTVPGRGRLSFRLAKGDAPKNSVTVAVPPDGTPVSCFVSGRWHSPGKYASAEDKDVAIEVVRGSSVLVSLPVMVRVRKNGELLTDAERDRFLLALAKLNAKGLGPFQFLRAMHVGGTLREAHGDRGFLPWHRAYLLDLERRLQEIDPSVALPYWKFDDSAARIFSDDFMGTSSSGNVNFSASNPLDNIWATDGGAFVIRRQPLFNPILSGGYGISEVDTLILGTDYDTFGDETGIESNPHNISHGSFAGLLADPRLAPTDPVFFLLHANVDRLWAKWQRADLRRMDPADPVAFFDSVLPTARRPRDPDGHRLHDTLWPWNGVKLPPRPPDAPGAPFPSSPVSQRFSAAPKVADLLDWQGRLDPLGSLGYDYDDVSW